MFEPPARLFGFVRKLGDLALQLWLHHDSRYSFTTPEGASNAVTTLSRSSRHVVMTISTLPIAVAPASETLLLMPVLVLDIERVMLQRVLDFLRSDSMFCNMT